MASNTSAAIIKPIHAKLGKQRQVSFIPLADERGVCRPLTCIHTGFIGIWQPEAGLNKRTCAIPEHVRGVFTTRHCTNQCLPYLTLTRKLNIEQTTESEGRTADTLQCCSRLVDSSHTCAWNYLMTLIPFWLTSADCIQVPTGIICLLHYILYIREQICIILTSSETVEKRTWH